MKYWILIFSTLAFLYSWKKTLCLILQIFCLLFERVLFFFFPKQLCDGQTMLSAVCSNSHLTMTKLGFICTYWPHTTFKQIFTAAFVCQDYKLLSPPCKPVVLNRRGSDSPGGVTRSQGGESPYALCIMESLITKLTNK